MTSKCHRHKLTITEEDDRIQISGDQKSLVALSTVLEFAYNQKARATRHMIVNNVFKNIVITCDEETE